jgi:hypothetical protein
MCICMRVYMCVYARMCMYVCVKKGMHTDYNDILVYVNEYVCKMKVLCHAYSYVCQNAHFRPRHQEAFLLSFFFVLRLLVVFFLVFFQFDVQWPWYIFKLIKVYRTGCSYC